MVVAAACDSLWTATDGRWRVWSLLDTRMPLLTLLNALDSAEGKRVIADELVACAGLWRLWS